MADLTSAGVLLRAYQAATHKGQTVFQAGKAAEKLSLELGFGRVVGRQWRLEPGDLPRIREYLVNHLGVRDPEYASSNFSSMDRITAAAVSPQEKFAGRGPHDGMVLVRGAGVPAQLNGTTLPALGRSCIYVHAADVFSIEHDCMIVVENFQALTHFEQFVLTEFPYTSPLLVFRGDATIPMNGAIALARKKLVPVIAFCDLDPQGCQIANSVPNRVGAIFPLEGVTLTRGDLYDKQRATVESLASLPDDWQGPVSAMVRARKGLTQEEMIAQGIPCALYGIDGIDTTRQKLSGNPGQLKG